MDLYENSIQLRCPRCGGRNIGEGTQSGYAAVVPKGRFFTSDTICYRICTDCGEVLGSYVKHPERFKPKGSKADER